jgi:hypothetical protein
VDRLDADPGGQAAGFQRQASEVVAGQLLAPTVINSQEWRRKLLPQKTPGWHGFSSA